jgi:hypothetical protein
VSITPRYAERAIETDDEGSASIRELDNVYQPSVVDLSGVDDGKFAFNCQPIVALGEVTPRVVVK